MHPARQQWPKLKSPTSCTPSPRSQNRDSFEYFATEHFRMSGVYWGLTALHLLGRADALPAEELVAWVLACQRPGGGFGGSERHDPHLLYTLSALQASAWGCAVAVQAELLHMILLRLPDAASWVELTSCVLALALADAAPACAADPGAVRCAGQGRCR